MKVTVDTNILVRAVVRDDVAQADLASKLLKDADLIAVSLTCLCEFVWVLRRLYRLDVADIAAAVAALADAQNVAVNRAAVEAGLAVLKAGGDFADGVIAFEGAWLDGETFASFDKKAVLLLSQMGQPAALIGG
jgi:predicted nucleic-acid-binding protein